MAWAEPVDGGVGKKYTPPPVPPQPVKPPVAPKPVYSTPATTYSAPSYNQPSYSEPPYSYQPSYGGGGGGGGYTVPVAPNPNAYAGLPEQYVAGLRGFLGDPSAYYAPRGAEKQAQTDYYNMLNTWQARTNYPLTPADWSNVWGNLNNYRQGYAVPGVSRQWEMGDALNYLNRMLASAPQTPQVAYLRTGEL